MTEGLMLVYHVLEGVVEHHEVEKPAPREVAHRALPYPEAVWVGYVLVQEGLEAHRPPEPLLCYPQEKLAASAAYIEYGRAERGVARYEPFVVSGKGEYLLQAFIGRAREDAVRRGGVTEIVQEGVTGEFFDVPVAEVCADALRRFIEKEGSYDQVAMRAAAGKFSQERFAHSFAAILSDALSSQSTNTL